MKRIILSSVIVMILSITGSAEICNSIGEYEYRFGDSENLKDAKQYCEKLAIRAAIEECALFVQSVTSIENYKLKDDLVNTIAVAFIKRKKVLECTVNENVIHTKVSIILEEEEMKKAIELEQSRANPKSNDKNAAEILSSAENIVYEEGFENIDEGMLPSSWLGGSTLSVQPSKMRNRANCVAPFSGGKHEFTIPNIIFPKDWTFEIEMSYDARLDDTGFKIKLGEIEFKLSPAYYNGIYKNRIMVNNINTGRPVPEKDRLNLIVIEKQGDVLKLYVNGEKMHTIRLVNPTPPRSIEFKYNRSFAIYRIRVTNAPGA